jgi:hypothetical protein
MESGKQHGKIVLVRTAERRSGRTGMSATSVGRAQRERHTTRQHQARHDREHEREVVPAHDDVAGSRPR